MQVEASATPRLKSSRINNFPELDEYPFQSWRRFKEAFAPAIVERAIAEHPTPISRCIDPFGGSGTTGIVSQIHGIHPVIAEVNPYLADLIEAKLANYNSSSKLTNDLNNVIDAVSASPEKHDADRFEALPPTFVEPGRKSRWVFDRKVALEILLIRDAIDKLPSASHRRLFRVLLGGTLVDVSNVVVSGKGRRYRGHWMRRKKTPRQVTELFRASAINAIAEISKWSGQKSSQYTLIRGDSRKSLANSSTCELAVFSPPYPNSFDYTDIYNLELWMLGYLGRASANIALRQRTLISHLQVNRQFPVPPRGSPTLNSILGQLSARTDELWDRRIPKMIGSYFSDLTAVLGQLGGVIVNGGRAWILIGDSRYAGIQIPTAKVLTELASARGWRPAKMESWRRMRTSPQQGGAIELRENLLVLVKSPLCENVRGGNL